MNKGETPQANIPTKEVPKSQQLGEHEYYAEGSKDGAEKAIDDYETYGNDALEAGKKAYNAVKDRAEKRFGGFFGKLRDGLTTIGNAVAKAGKVTLGFGVVAGVGTGKIAVGVVKEGGQILVANKDLAKAGIGAAVDLAAAGTVSTVAGGLEAAMYAEEKYKQGKEYADKKAAEAEELARQAKDATIRGGKKVAKGAAIAGAVGAGGVALGVGGVALGTAAVGAAVVGGAALGAAAMGGAALGAGYLTGRGMEAGARFAGDKATKSIDALNRGADATIKTAETIAATGRMKFQDAKKFVTDSANAGIDVLNRIGNEGVKREAQVRDTLKQTADALVQAKGELSLTAQAELANFSMDLQDALDSGATMLAADIKAMKDKVDTELEKASAAANDVADTLNTIGNEGMKKEQQIYTMIKETKQALTDAAGEMTTAAQAELTNQLIDVDGAVNSGVASTVGELIALKAGLEQGIAEAGETAAKDLLRLEADLDRGAQRLNELYDDGAKTLNEYNGRMTKARSAWDDFMNAGRQAKDAFMSIFKGNGKQKQLAENVVKAIEQQKQLDEAAKNTEIKPVKPVIRQTRGNQQES